MSALVFCCLRTRAGSLFQLEKRDRGFRILDQGDVPWWRARVLGQGDRLCGLRGAALDVDRHVPVLAFILGPMPVDIGLSRTEIGCSSAGLSGPPIATPLAFPPQATKQFSDSGGVSGRHSAISSTLGVGLRPFPPCDIGEVPPPST